ncbi:MAG TPA: hypothetical protein VF423_00625, partial [Actinomycetes bacterium]
MTDEPRRDDELSSGDSPWWARSPQDAWASPPESGHPAPPEEPATEGPAAPSGGPSGREPWAHADTEVLDRPRDPWAVPDTLGDEPRR